MVIFLVLEFAGLGGFTLVKTNVYKIMLILKS